MSEQQTKRDQGGSVYPLEYSTFEYRGDSAYTKPTRIYNRQHGMSLRQHYAGLAMQQLMADKDYAPDYEESDFVDDPASLSVWLPSCRNVVTYNDERYVRKLTAEGDGNRRVRVVTTSRNRLARDAYKMADAMIAEGKK
jgi:hypothetical protein